MLMKKWLIILLVLILNVTFLKVKGTNTRKIASTEMTVNCSDAIRFFGNYSFSYAKYNEYLSSFKTGKTSTDIFSELEEYMAWIDYKIGHGSLVEALLNQKLIRQHYSSFILKRSRPGEMFNYLFENLAQSVIRKSIDPSKFTTRQEKYLHKMMTDKIIDEAFIVASDESSKFGKFINSMPVQKFVDVLMYLPVVVGMPPLKVPDIISKNHKWLLRAGSIEELEKRFVTLSKQERNSLKSQIKYKTFQKYYGYGVASFYFVFMSYQMFTIEKRVEEIETMNQYADETIEDLHSLVNPSSCESLLSCLNDFKSDWEGKTKEAYMEVKASCIEVYDISKDCD